MWQADADFPVSRILKRTGVSVWRAVELDGGGLSNRRAGGQPPGVAENRAFDRRSRQFRSDGTLYFNASQNLVNVEFCVHTKSDGTFISAQSISVCSIMEDIGILIVQ